VRNGADCPAIDRYREALHDEAVATGAPTAEPEEARGAEDAQNAPPPPVATAVAPPVQTSCPATFGNSDIFGVTVPDPTP